MTDEEISKLWLNHYPSANDFARAIIAARDEELRKQEPVGFGCFDPAGFLDQDLVGTEADCIFWRDSPDATNKWTVKALFTAPIPPTEVEPATEYAEYILDHYDRKSRKDRKLLGKHLAEWADRRYRDAAPIPPTVTPSQQKVLSAVDTLLATFDSGYHPELNLIRDFMLARPDAPIPTTGETK